MLTRTGAALIAILALGLPIPTWADVAQDKRWCRSDPNPEIRISACTRLVQSGRFGNNDLAIAFYYRGLAYNKTRQYDLAIRDFNKAIGFVPNYTDAMIDKGISYFNKGEYYFAIQSYSRAIRFESNYATPFNNRGNAYGVQGYYGLAIRDFNEAIRLEPDFAGAFLNRAKAYRSKGQYGRAIRDFNEVIRLKPGFAPGYNGHAWLLATSTDAKFRDGKKAVAMALKAVSSKRIPNYLDTLAAAYAEAGQFGDAVRVQQQMLDMLRASGAKPQGVKKFQDRLNLYKSKKPYRE